MTGPTREIAPGVHMPLLGFGTYLLEDGTECLDAITTALEVGYRHIDTAWMYENERSVGAAIRSSGLPRDEVFVTTKLWNSRQGPGTRDAFHESLDRLGLEHVDLYLIHWPEGSRWEASWETMQSFIADGTARSIGVSNFLVPHLDRIEQLGLPMPANNQIELHPFLYGKRRDVLDRCEAADVSITAYSPLTRGRRFDHPTVVSVAAEHGCTPAQALIRWGLEHGYASIPKSANPDRIRENFAVVDLAFDDDDLAALDRLDETLVVSWNPDRTL